MRRLNKDFLQKANTSSFGVLHLEHVKVISSQLLYIKYQEYRSSVEIC